MSETKKIIGPLFKYVSIEPFLPVLVYQFNENI